jgi:excisionase family DNA binding protein
MDLLEPATITISYSVEQASERTSVSKSYIRNEIRDGRLKAKLVGRRVLIPATALKEWIENGQDWKPIAERAAVAA